MGQLQRAFVPEYVRLLLQGIASEAGYSPGALSDLSQQNLDLADALYVLETSIYLFVEKENSHESIFIIEGANVDDEPIKMTLIFNPHTKVICVEKVSRL
jgi:hypothetical protein